MDLDPSRPCLECGGAHVTDDHVESHTAKALSGQSVVSPRFCLCDHGCAVLVDVMAAAMEAVRDTSPEIGHLHAILTEMAEALRRSGRILTPDLLPSGGILRTAGV